MNMSNKISVVVPAYNEEAGIKSVVENIRNVLGGKFDYEIIVVDDCSQDKTGKIASAAGARVIRNSVNSGQGASVKNGLRAAAGDYAVLIDADGTYPADKIPALIKKLDEGFDLAVGARTGKNYWRGGLLTSARLIFKWLAEIIAFKKIPDINSGLRAFRRDKALPILDHCSNRFSFMTSLTLIFLLKKYKAAYVPIDYYARRGKSKVHYAKDALRTLKIMFKIAFLYKPIFKKEILWVGLAALAVGFLFIVPPLAIRNYFIKADQPFVLATLGAYRDELYTYLPRAREIYDGHFPPADLSLDQQGATPFNVLPSLIFSGLLALSGGSVTAAYLAAQFLFSGVIFILLYFLGRLIFKEKTWAFFIALAGVLTPFLINVFNFDFKDDLKILFDYTVKQFAPFVRTQIDKLRLARLDEPLLTYPVYLSAFLAFLAFWKNPRTRNAVLMAVPAGLLAYTYVHHWIYWMVFLGLMFLYSAVNFKIDFRRFRSYLIGLLVLAVLLVPYFVNYFAFKNLAAAEDAGYRFTVFQGRSLGIGRENLADHIVYLVLAALVWLLYFRKPRPESQYLGWIFLGMIAAILISRNIQLVLGQTPTPSKWDNAFSPAFYLMFFAAIYELTKRVSARFIMPILIVLSGLVAAKYAFNAIAVFAKPQAEVLSYYQLPKEVMESWDWINKNLPPEPKIISPSYDTSIYLMTYTSARPYVPRGLLSLASNFEIEERFLTANKLFGVSYLRIAPEAFNLWGGWFEKRRLSDYLNFRYPSLQPKVDELNDRYQKMKIDWSDIDAQYVYEGPWEKTLGAKDLSGETDLKLIYSNLSVRIYEIVK
jgi:glycosyltransferase involved in cell wall biosynthesis